MWSPERRAIFAPSQTRLFTSFQRTNASSFRGVCSEGGCCFHLRLLGVSQNRLRRWQRRQNLGGNVTHGGKLRQAFLPLGERFTFISLLAETALVLLAARAKHRIHVAAEQRGNIDLHLL